MIHGKHHCCSHFQIYSWQIVTFEELDFLKVFKFHWVLGTQVAILQWATLTSLCKILAALHCKTTTRGMVVQTDYVVLASYTRFLFCFEIHCLLMLTAYYSLNPPVWFALFCASLARGCWHTCDAQLVWPCSGLLSSVHGTAAYGHGTVYMIAVLSVDGRTAAAKWQRLPVNKTSGFPLVTYWLCTCYVPQKTRLVRVHVKEKLWDVHQKTSQPEIDLLTVGLFFLCIKRNEVIGLNVEESRVNVTDPFFTFSYS